MEIKTLSQNQIDLLRKKLPDEAVTQHPTKTFLSSIKAIYVVERLNEVFGIGKWFANNEVVVTTGKMVVVKSTFQAPEYGIVIPDIFGGNDNPDLGDAYKGACTDALTKIGSYLEIGMDVFKGKHTAKGTSTPKTESSTPELPWLNPKDTDKWQAVLSYLVKDNGTVDKIKKKYRLSKENENLLLNQASEAI